MGKLAKILRESPSVEPPGRRPLESSEHWAVRPPSLGVSEPAIPGPAPRPPACAKLPRRWGVTDGTPWLTLTQSGASSTSLQLSMMGRLQADDPLESALYHTTHLCRSNPGEGRA